MKWALGIAALSLVLALGLGFYAGNQPAAFRASDLTVPVTDQWVASLPKDPDAATAAYLARVPAIMQARGAAVSVTQFWILAGRIGITVGALALFLFSGLSSRLAAITRRLKTPVWCQDVLYAVGLLAFLFVLLLPVEVFAGYVRLRTFGFADRPFLSWLQDFTINWAVMTLFYVCGITVIFAIIRRWPKAWMVAATAVYLALALAYNTAGPSLIEPLFNKFTPLPESPIKTQIENLVRSAHVLISNVYASNASAQTRVVNAHVSGIGGTAQVTLDDNLLAGKFEPQIRFVVAHELGHFVLHHQLKATLFSTLLTGIGFLFVGWVTASLIRRFGQVWKIETATETSAIAVFWLAFLAWGFLSQPAMDAFSRWQEARADTYGLNLSREPNGMAEFMIHNADTQTLNPSPVEVFLLYDHPSDRSRVEAAMRWRAQPR